MPIHQQSDTDFLGHTLDMYDQQRDKKKAEEDHYLEWQQNALEHFLNSPLANQDPSVQQGLLQDLHETVHARFGKRPRQRSMDGFFGATEMPKSRMLESVMGGGRPLTGSPTQDVPPPPSAQQQGLIPEMGTVAPKLQDETGAPLPMQGPQAVSTPQPKPLEPPIEPGSIQRRHEEYAKNLVMPAPQPFLPVSPQEAPTGGASVLMSPVGVPPDGAEPSATSSRIASAGRQMQQFNDGPKVIPVPPQKQPLMLDRATAAKEAGNLEGTKYAARRKGEIQGEAEALTAPLPGETEPLFPKSEARAIIKNKEGGFGRSGAVGKVNGGTATVDGEPNVEVVQLPNGQFMRPDTQEVIEGAGRVYNFAPHAKAGGAMAGANLTPEGIKFLADQFEVTGKLPAMGMGNTAAAMRAAVVQELAQRQVQRGIPINSALAQANMSVNTADLKQATLQANSLESFSKNAERNMGTFLQAASKIKDTGSPFLNMTMRAAQMQGMGNEDLAAFRTARQVVIPEYVRILTDNTLNHALKETDMEEMRKALPDSATLGQIISSMTVLMQDAANRRASVLDRVNNAKFNLSSAHPDNANQVAPPPIQPERYMRVPATNSQGQPNKNAGQIAISRDGGKSWQLFKPGENPSTALPTPPAPPTPSAPLK